MLDVSNAVETHAVRRAGGRAITEKDVSACLDQGLRVIEIKSEGRAKDIHKYYAFPADTDVDNVGIDLINGYAYSPAVLEVSKNSSRIIRAQATD